MFKNLVLVSLVLMLTACGSSHRPRYSGHQESTEGVPGFVNGKKVAPNVKLGQSYTVDGETYVPRYEPDYVEEGMASWYGPGFHGGKTANGEEFDKHELTGAHRTLPLPSIVKVTLLSTGKSAYVRINDRGPFAKSRIIDLSYGSAKEIGLIGPGTGRVRVQYMPAESQRFVDLMAQGRDPKSIDLDDEVIGKSSTMFADNRVHETVWSQPVSQETVSSVAQDSIETHDLMMPANAPVPPVAAAPVAAPAPITVAPTPVAEPAQVAQLEAPASTLPVSRAPAPAAAAGGVYVQLGAFLQQANAERIQKKVTSIGATHVSPVTNESGATLYRVRMGPYSNVDESTRVLEQLAALGINPKLVTK